MDTKSHKLTDARREMFYAELHALLTAGLDFSAAFRLLIEGEGDRRTKALLEELYAAVVRGLSLAEAMRRSGAFRPLECGVVRIGDETGRLARTLDFLRDYYRKRAAQRRMVASAVSYPVVILAVAAAVVAFMLSVVVPMFEEVYARMGGELPALTRGIIALSKAFPAYVAVAVSAGGGLYLLYRANRQREEVHHGIFAASACSTVSRPCAGEIPVPSPGTARAPRPGAWSGSRPSCLPRPPRRKPSPAWRAFSPTAGFPDIYCPPLVEGQCPSATSRHAGLRKIPVCRGIEPDHSVPYPSSLSLSALKSNSSSTA